MSTDKPDYTALFDRLPHAAPMRLLEAIEHLDAEQIVCRVSSHTRPDHPMRYADRLGAACGVEMAAQAVALHCANALAGASAAGGGMLTSVRDLVLSVDRLDTIASALTVSANLISADGMGALYTFSIVGTATGSPQELVRGRLSVVNFVR